MGVAVLILGGTIEDFTVLGIVVRDIEALVIELIEGQTGHLVDTGELIEPVCITVTAFHITFGTINDTFFAVLLRQGQDLALQEGGIGGEVDAPVAVAEDVEVGLDLDAAVGHRTDVLGDRRVRAARRGCTGGDRKDHVEEQVFVAAVEVFDIEVPPVEQAGLNTDAPALAGFPFEVIVRHQLKE